MRATQHRNEIVKDIQFKPLAVEDLPQLAEWLRQPHIAKWWPSPGDEGAIAAKYIPRIRNETPVSVFIVSAGGEPAGMIQAEQHEQTGISDGYGVDLFIGNPELTGQGLGPEIIEAFVTGYIFGRYAAARCTADPELANTRSVRAFEKAGFVRLGMFSEKGVAHVLLERCLVI